MRKRLAILGLISVGLLWAAITFVAAVPASNYGGGTLCASAATLTSQTCTISVTAGDFLVVAIAGGNGTIAVTDSQLNSYTQVASFPDPSTVRISAMWVSPSVASTGSLIVMVTDTVASYISLNVLRYTGVATTGYLDVATGGSNNGTTAPCGTLTTTNANDVLLISYNAPNGGSGTPSTGFTLRSVQPNSSCCEASGVADQVVSALGPYSPTWTAGMGGNTACASVALKALSASTKISRRVIQ